jgi:hypothetical protein
VRHDGWYAAVAQNYAVNTRRNRWVFADPAIAQIWASPAAQTLQDALAACESIPTSSRRGAYRWPRRPPSWVRSLRNRCRNALHTGLPGMERPRRADGCAVVVPVSSAAEAMARTPSSSRAQGSREDRDRRRTHH